MASVTPLDAGPTAETQAHMYDKLVDVESLLDELVRQSKRTNKAVNRLVAIQRRMEKAVVTVAERLPARE